MAVISLIAVDTGHPSNTLNLPGTIQSGDLLLLVITIDSTNAASMDDPVVSGGGTGTTWQKLSGGGGASHQTIWWKRATANSASSVVGVTLPPFNSDYSACVAAFRNVREVQFHQSLQAESGGSLTTTPGLLAPNVPNAWVVLAVSFNETENTFSANATATNPAALPLLAESKADCTTALFAAQQTSHAGTGAFSWTFTGGTSGTTAYKTALYLIPRVELVAERRSLALSSSPANFVNDGVLFAATGAFSLVGAQIGMIVGGRLTRASRGNPSWARDASIGEVGGSLTKEDSKTEGQEPAAAMWLREIRAMRGSLYTTKPHTLVHIENLMMARHFAAVWSRAPEKFRANQSPARSDERLAYWVEVLGIPVKPGDAKQDVRARAAAHHRAASGAALPELRNAVAELLGDAFVDIITTRGTDLATPPANTFWPVINPGPASHNLGHGAWTSPRAHYVIQVTRPPGTAEAAFNNLVNVQLFQLLDRMLPGVNSFESVEV